MNIAKKNILIIFSLSIIFGCIEPFEPDIDGYDDFLVVEGGISNESPPYQIRLTRTTAYDDSELPVERGAIVIIRDDQGNEETLQEGNNGIYTSSEDGIRGIAGVSYQLEIQTQGNNYLSEWVTMPDSVPIQSINKEYNERILANDMVTEGFEILVNNNGGGTGYYRWTWEETWRFSLPGYDTIINQICWQSNRSNNLLIGSSSQVQGINNAFIRNVTLDDGRLLDRYSIQVNQYTITEDAYNYWLNIANLNQNTGTLFDPLPYEIQGNITNIEDPEERVVGFFEASGVSSERIFISNEELPSGKIPFNYFSNFCTKSFDSRTEALAEGFDVLVFPVVMGPDTYLRRECLDCENFGTADEPDFWTE